MSKLFHIFNTFIDNEINRKGKRIEFGDPILLQKSEKSILEHRLSMRNFCADPLKMINLRNMKF